LEPLDSGPALRAMELKKVLHGGSFFFGRPRLLEFFLLGVFFFFFGLGYDFFFAGGFPLQGALGKCASKTTTNGFRGMSKKPQRWMPAENIPCVTRSGRFGRDYEGLKSDSFSMVPP